MSGTQPTSFAEFQATRRYVSDLAVASEHIAAQGIEPGIAGYIYGDGLFIERTDNGRYQLTIGSMSVISSNLEKLERELYAFAVAEGYAS